MKQTTSTMRLGTITGISPLRVQLDGDSAVLPYAPKIVSGSQCRVNDRVLCDRIGGQFLILGVLKNYVSPAEIVRNTASTSSGGGTAAANSLRDILSFTLTEAAPRDGLLAVQGSSGLAMPTPSGTMWLGLGINKNSGGWVNRRWSPGDSQATQLPFAASFQEYINQGDNIQVRLTCHHNTTTSLTINWTYAYLDAYIIPRYWE